MVNQFERTELIYGKQVLEKLKNMRVAIFGVGGVGGYVVEALARCGIGTLDLFDNDTITPSNLNRQIIALHSTIGRLKVEVAAERILDINPNAKVNPHAIFYLPETAEQIDLSVYDYVVDAIDTVAAKLELVVRCKALNIPIISAMGAGNKINASLFEVADIYDTSICPLAKVMRRELKKRGVESLKVVYSKEKPRKPMTDLTNISEKNSVRRQIPGSTSFAPAAAGIVIAGEVINDLAKR